MAKVSRGREGCSVSKYTKKIVKVVKKINGLRILTEAVRVKERNNVKHFHTLVRLGALNQR